MSANAPATLKDALATAYSETLDGADVTGSALRFADEVERMIGLDIATDRDLVISDLRWLGIMLALAADKLEGL